MAVLPTPGSPICRGLFFSLRQRICMVRSSSRSRPISGFLPSSSSPRQVAYCCQKPSSAKASSSSSSPCPQSPSSQASSSSLCRSSFPESDFPPEPSSPEPRLPPNPAKLSSMEPAPLPIPAKPLSPGWPKPFPSSGRADPCAFLSSAVGFVCRPFFLRAVPLCLPFPAASS